MFYDFNNHYQLPFWDCLDYNVVFARAGAPEQNSKNCC